MWTTPCFSQLRGLAMQETAMVNLVALPCDIFGTLQLPKVLFCPFPDVHSTSCDCILLLTPCHFFALFAFPKKSVNHHLEASLSLSFGLLGLTACPQSWSNIIEINHIQTANAL